PAAPLKLHSVSRRTPQAPSKPYAFTQQSRMSSTQTPIDVKLFNRYSFFSSAQGLQIIEVLSAASTVGIMIPSAAFSVKSPVDTLPVNAFIWYIISYPGHICQYI
ncbi:MAG: hypothetical protein IKZ09_07300, partial [Clostridia bacterium]|nr:hypothetical protein [Clostridia bacterium]